MVSKLPLVIICEIKLLFKNLQSQKRIKDKLDYLDIPVKIKNISKKSISVNREEYYFKRKNNEYVVDICYKMEVKPTSFFISDINIVFGYLVSNLLKLFKKKRTEIIGKKISNIILGLIYQDKDISKKGILKYCRIYELRKYSKNEIIIPLYERLSR